MAERAVAVAEVGMECRIRAEAREGRFEECNRAPVFAHPQIRIAERVEDALGHHARGPHCFELAGRFINLGKSGRPTHAFLDPDEALRWLEAQPEA